MKYAVIGTSWISEEFVKAAASTGEFELVGVCSRSRDKGEAFAARIGATKVFTQLTELAQSPEVEAVYIASPNSLHYPQSKTMLLSGKHVLCEKPLAVTPQQIEELTLTANRLGLVYMEAIMFLHTPALSVLKTEIREIGKVTSATLDFSQLSSKYNLLQNGKIPNIFNPECAAGCLMDIGVYNVYTAVELFGVPLRVKSWAQLLSTGADGCGSALLEYPDKLVTLVYSKIGQSRAPSQIYGDKGTILIDSISLLTGMVTVLCGGEKKLLCGEKDRTEIMSCEARAFYSFVRKRELTRESYERAQRLAIEVSRVMLEIRRQCGNFPF